MVSGTQLQHSFAVGFLQVLQLLLVLFADLQRIRPLGITHPALNLGLRKVLGPTGLCHRRLALDDLNHQRRLTLGSPTFYAVVHR